MDFQILNVTIPSENAGDILMKEVWSKLRPNWKSENIASKKLTGGNINDMVAYYLSDDTSMDDAVVVRLFGTKVEGFECPEQELINMQRAHYSGCGPKILAVINNGIIYKYIKGRPIKLDDLHKDENNKRVAQLLAQLHWTDISKCHLVGLGGKKAELKVVENAFPGLMRQIIEVLPDSLSHVKDYDQRIAGIKKELREAADFIGGIMRDLDLPHVNCHGDLNCNNVLLDDDSGDALFIDYEFAGYSLPAVFDSSYMLNIYIYSKLGDVVFDPSRRSLPTQPESEETLRLWMTSYLQRMHELQGHDVSKLSEKEVEEWMLAMRIMDTCFIPHTQTRLLSHAPIIKFPLLMVYDMAMDAYRSGKPGLAKLKEQYLKLKSS